MPRVTSAKIAEQGSSKGLSLHRNSENISKSGQNQCCQNSPKQPNISKSEANAESRKGRVKHSRTSWCFTFSLAQKQSRRRQPTFPARLRRGDIRLCSQEAVLVCLDLYGRTDTRYQPLFQLTQNSLRTKKQPGGCPLRIMNKTLPLKAKNYRWDKRYTYQMHWRKNWGKSLWGRSALRSFCL